MLGNQLVRRLSLEFNISIVDSVKLERFKIKMLDIIIMEIVKMHICQQ